MSASLSNHTPVCARPAVGKGLLFFFTWLLVSACLFAQGPFEPFAHYTSESGLPQNSVNALHQDKNGFIWIATNSGLVRYDGQHFRVFNMLDYADGSSNRIQNLFVFEGKLYADEPGFPFLFRIDNENTITAVPRNIVVLWRKAAAYRIAEELKPYKSTFNINSWWDMPITEDGTAGYCAESAGYELVYYNYPDKPVGLGLFAPANNDQYFLLNERLYVIDPQLQLVCFNKTRRVVTGGTFKKVLDLLSPADRDKCKVQQRGQYTYFSDKTHIYILHERGPGIVDADILTDKTQGAAIASFLYLPDQQMLLFGTSNDGLFIYHKAHFKTIRVPDQVPAYFEKNNAAEKPVNIFYSIARQSDTSMVVSWGAISTGGVVMPGRGINFERWQIAEVAPGLFIGRRISETAVRLYDRNFQDLGLFDASSGINFFGPAFYSNDTTYFHVRVNDKWVIRQYHFVPPHSFRQLDEFPINQQAIYQLAKGKGDTLWVATIEGLYTVNLRTRQLQPVKGLESAVVRSLYLDKNQTLWIGTYGKGWYRYNQEGLIQLYMDRNAFLENVHSFQEDPNGFLWVTTNNGMFRFFKTDLQRSRGPGDPVYYNYFTRQYGFLSNEFNGGCNPSSLVLPDGRFVFPSMNGLVMFQPKEVPLELPRSTILSGEYQLDGQPLPELQGMRLQPGFNNLTFRIYAPYLGQSYNLQVEYRLSSGAEAWTKLPENGLLVFNRLAPGSYTLSARMLKGFGTGEYIYYDIAFEVKPYWYQRPWFYIGLLLLTVLLSIFYARWRIRAVQRQKRLLEEQVDNRTAALRASEEKVKQNAEFKAKVTSLVLHDVRSPLYYLNKITASIYKASEGKVAEPFREQLKDLHLSVKDISAYAQTLFAWISAQQDNFVLSSATVELSDLFDELSQNYSLLAQEGGNTITYDHGLRGTVYTQADLLQIVLRNLVDNAIKYTRNGTIELGARFTPQEVIIQVRDTGKGMDAERISRVSGELDPAPADTRSGMGYRFIRDLLQKMEGRLAIESQPGVGTTVSVILPLKKAKHIK